MVLEKCIEEVNWLLAARDVAEKLELCGTHFLYSRI